jgi:hypothetical protein
MAITRFSYQEMILLRLLELNPLLPHYWSELFMLSFQLFDPTSEQYAELQQMIRDVEELILSPPQVGAGLSLYDIEMAFESNPDYYAYFERDDGVQVTKFDVERELSKIKSWIYQHVRVQAVGRKFQRYR